MHESSLKTGILGLLVISALLVTSGCVSQNDGQDSQPQLTGDAIQDAQPTVYSLSDISLHDSADDCWIAIHGKVYDVTEFIPTHPGGEAILQGCGKDATDFYETRPMGSGTPHSARARNLLPNYEIGILAG